MSITSQLYFGDIPLCFCGTPAYVNQPRTVNLENGQTISVDATFVCDREPSCGFRDPPSLFRSAMSQIEPSYSDWPSLDFTELDFDELSNHVLTLRQNLENSRVVCLVNSDTAEPGADFCDCDLCEAECDCRHGEIVSRVYCPLHNTNVDSPEEERLADMRRQGYITMEERRRREALGIIVDLPANEEEEREEEMVDEDECVCRNGEVDDRVYCPVHNSNVDNPEEEREYLTDSGEFESEDELDDAETVRQNVATLTDAHTAITRLSRLANLITGDINVPFNTTHRPNGTSHQFLNSHQLGNGKRLILFGAVCNSDGQSTNTEFSVDVRVDGSTIRAHPYRR